MDFLDSTEEMIQNEIVINPIYSADIITKTIGSLKNRIKITRTRAISWNVFLKRGDNHSFKDVEYEEKYPAVMVHTGGTTGKAKTVVLSNESLNTLCLNHILGGFDISRGDTFLNFLPPFYAYGICGTTNLPFSLGFRVRYLPVFDADDFPGLMKKYKPNIVFGGPILFDRMMNSKLTRNLDLDFFRFPVSGGDSMSIEFEKQVNQYLKNNNCKHSVQQGYGLTEAASSCCFAKEGTTSVGSVGIPHILNVISIFDPDDSNKELTYNEEGEICVNSECMMNEYYNNPNETADVIKEHNDGTLWVHTGDIGYMKENGNLYVVGRIKRAIVTNGSKIFPLDLENFILKDSKVRYVAVVGAEEKKNINVPVAHIVFKDIQREEINEYINKLNIQISKVFPDFYTPWLYIVRSSLPLTNLGKIDYNKLENEKYKFDDKVIYL